MTNDEQIHIEVQARESALQRVILSLTAELANVNAQAAVLAKRVEERDEEIAELKKGEA